MAQSETASIYQNAIDDLIVSLTQLLQPQQVIKYIEGSTSKNSSLRKWKISKETVQIKKELTTDLKKDIMAKYKEEGGQQSMALVDQLIFKRRFYGQKFEEKLDYFDQQFEFLKQQNQALETVEKKISGK